MMDIFRRFSVNDANYDPRAAANLVVHLDGVDQYGRVVAYDVDAGSLTRAKHDRNGKIYVVDNEIALETVHGIVTVQRRG